MTEPIVEEKGLTFKTEEDKMKRLEEIQKSVPTEEDLPEIERVTNAPVLEKAPEAPRPADDLVEPEPQPEPVETEENPVQEEKPTDDARNWTIDEELLKKYDGTYKDQNGREKNYFTHKDPETLVKSYVDSQKHIQYLTAQRLPQEYQTGYEKGKSELEEKLADLQKQLDEAAKQPKPEAPPQEPAPVDSAVFDEYTKLSQELSQVPEGDEVEHLDKFRRLSVLTPKVLEEKERLQSENINKIKTEIAGEFNSFKTEWQTKQEQSEALKAQQAEQKKKAELISNVHAQIDDWKNSPDAPEEAKSDQSFRDMSNEALGFHNSLAELYTGKTERDYTQQQWSDIKEKAGTAYLNGLPELMQRVANAGVKAPENYKTWVFLDNIDAIKSGYIRNSNNEWEERYDKVTGQKVNLGDMKSAYNWWLEETGQREKQVLDATKKANDNLLHTITKRDNQMVQLDDSQLTPDGAGGTMTSEDAEKILNEVQDTIGMEAVFQQAMQGNPETLNKVNAALKRLGQEPIEMAKQYVVP
jgi:hypothetical protein